MFNKALVPFELGMHARCFCSARFLMGLSDEEARKHFGGPSLLKGSLTFKTDEDRRRVSATYQRFTSTAQFFDEQGSVVLPGDSWDISFTPVRVQSNLPAADTLEWPMGDLEVSNVPAPTIDLDGVRSAIACAFDHPDNLTAAVVVVHKGVIVGEGYDPYLKKSDGKFTINRDTQLPSWSMGKSLLATLFSRLILDNTFSLDQNVPVPEWQSEGDLRSNIKIRDLLQMSGGLSFSSPMEEGFSSDNGYPDHMRGYTDPIDVHRFARETPLDNSDSQYKGRYLNCDPWVIGSILKDAVLARGEEYLSFPQRALFDHIGIRRQVVETDPFGNFIFTGCDFGTARNWARLGLLYLQNGIWNGKRILPEGWTDFVRKPAPAWKSEEYGGLFWLNKTNKFPMLPQNTYFAAGGGCQYTFIVPDHDLVVVRMGYLHNMSVIDGLCPLQDETVGPKPSVNRMLTMLMRALSK